MLLTELNQNMEQFATVKDPFAYSTSSGQDSLIAVHVNFLTSRPTPFHFSSAVDFNPENYFLKNTLWKNNPQITRLSFGCEIC